MEIIVGKTAGFCFGVSNAVNRTEELLSKEKNIYCIGDLVHNKQVIEELENKGLIIIDNIENAKNSVIIRAHGEPKEIYEKAKQKKIKIIDLTCPKVLKIHNIVTQYSNKGYYIFLVGQQKHPETVGTISYCRDNSCIIEKEEDIKNAIKKLYNSNIKKLLIISQTTYNIEKFNNIISIIKERIKETTYNIELEIENTICDATRLRQEEAKNIAEEVEAIIIIGGRHSSNTNKLYQISSKYCKNCVLIETKEELDINYIKKFKKIGIMAGASTPQKSIKTVVEMLEQI